jgi:hypothetical protein
MALKLTKIKLNKNQRQLDALEIKIRKHQSEMAAAKIRDGK